MSSTTSIYEAKIMDGVIPIDDYTFRPFLTTNEEKHAICLKHLKMLPVKGTLIIGVSCLAVLNMAAIRPIPPKELSIVIVDLGARVLDFWKKILPIITTSPDCANFIERLKIVYLSEQPNWGKDLPKDLSYEAPLSRFDKEVMVDKISWCSNETSFQKIKRMISSGRLAIFGADITNPIHTEELKKHINTSLIDTIYTSNCHEYIHWGKNVDRRLDLYVRAINNLASESHPYIVSTEPRFSEDLPLIQTIVPYESMSQMNSFFMKPSLLGPSSLPPPPPPCPVAHILPCKEGEFFLSEAASLQTQDEDSSDDSIANTV